ncbi:hypothetical protein GQ42DRAFT_17230 [Ramicandelaber brevisporus]|nr:hypothetical protein GQ42DRAFT_17230 [Ramicandelaber brevisporus]
MATQTFPAHQPLQVGFVGATTAGAGGDTSGGNMGSALAVPSSPSSDSSRSLTPAPSSPLTPPGPDALDTDMDDGDSTGSPLAESASVSGSIMARESDYDIDEDNNSNTNNNSNSNSNSNNNNNNDGGSGGDGGDGDGGGGYRRGTRSRTRSQHDSVTTISGRRQLKRSHSSANLAQEATGTATATAESGVTGSRRSLNSRLEAVSSQSVPPTAPPHKKLNRNSSMRHDSPDNVIRHINGESDNHHQSVSVQQQANGNSTASHTNRNKSRRRSSVDNASPPSSPQSDASSTNTNTTTNVTSGVGVKQQRQVAQESMSGIENELLTVRQLLLDYQLRENEDQIRLWNSKNHPILHKWNTKSQKDYNADLGNINKHHSKLKSMLEMDYNQTVAQARCNFDCQRKLLIADMIAELQLQILTTRDEMRDELYRDECEDIYKMQIKPENAPQSPILPHRKHTSYMLHTWELNHDLAALGLSPEPTPQPEQYHPIFSQIPPFAHQDVPRVHISEPPPIIESWYKPPQPPQPPLQQSQPPQQSTQQQPQPQSQPQPQPQLDQLSTPKLNTTEQPQQSRSLNVKVEGDQLKINNDMFEINDYISVEYQSLELRGTVVEIAESGMKIMRINGSTVHITVADIVNGQYVNMKLINKNQPHPQPQQQQQPPQPQQHSQLRFGNSPAGTPSLGARPLNQRSSLASSTASMLHQ